MEPDHEDRRTNEEPSTQEYWEARITTECLSTLKAGSVDRSQKAGHYHSQKGHIEVNCPKRRKAETPLRVKHKWKIKKTLIQKSHHSVGRDGKKFICKPSPPSK